MKRQQKSERRHGRSDHAGSSLTCTSVATLLMVCGALLWLTACGDDVKNSAPSIINVDSEYRVAVGTTLEINVSATDPDGDPVVISMPRKPPGSNFIFETFGRFVWTPEANDASDQPFELVFEARDARGATSTLRSQVLVTATGGQLRFITSNSRVLDLTRNDTLVAQVAVQRDDVTVVSLGLENAPEGMTLTSLGGKSAELRWTPTSDQIARKLIWGATINASVGDDPPAAQNMTITLVTRSCGEGATQVTHTPVADQRGSDDYVINADINSPNGGELQATLFWRLGGDPNDSGGFDGVTMTQSAGATWSATIPNPNTLPGKPRDIYYFIVAFSEADRASGCIARAPEQGLHSFASFAAGDNDCRQDAFEPNDDASSAAVLAEDTEGLTVSEGLLEAFGLALCEGDKDLFAIDLEANQGAAVLITYNSALGDMHLRGLGPDGQEVLIESSESVENESSILLPAATSGRYFFEVTGSPQGYRLAMSLRDNINPNCIDTELEPNEAPDNAPILPPGTYEGLQTCPGDKDFFVVRVPAGNNLNASIAFSHDDGDLDLLLRDQRGHVIASSTSVTDDESLNFFNSDGLSTYALEIRPINDAIASYTLTIDVDEGGDMCQADRFEPNDTFEQAAADKLTNDIDADVTMCGDDDIYAMDLEVGQSVSVFITFDNDVADLDIELFDPDINSAAFSAGLEDTEDLEHVATVAGTHYLKVTAYDQLRPLNYIIEIITQGGDPGPRDCTNDANEENGARALAIPLEDAQTRDVGLCASDEDWFVIFPGGPARDILATVEPVAIDVGDPGAELLFEMHDVNGQVITEGEFGLGTFDLLAELNSAEPVFLRVANNGNNPYLYNLDVLIE